MAQSSSAGPASGASRPVQGECIEFEGGRTGSGYGIFPDGRLAHRVSYERMHGPIPERWVVDHLCRNRACWYWKHLEAVPNRENVLRGMSPAADHARRVVCVNGHPFSEENTRIGNRGQRECITCRRESWRRWNEKKRLSSQSR